MTKKSSLRTFAFGLPLVFSVAASVLAQSNNGIIHGTVLDPSGALVPQAQITITSAAGFNRKLKTSATGAFEVQHLAPGSYSVSIDAHGFTPALEGDIQVVGNKVTDQNITLGISVNQEINVFASDVQTKR